MSFLASFRDRRPSAEPSSHPVHSRDPESAAAGLPEKASAHVIIGHTTHDSAWIWVRGNWWNRRFTLDLETVPREEGDKPTSATRRPVDVRVDRARDYTKVVRFDSKLEPDMVYRVVLRSRRDGSKVAEGHLRTFQEPDGTDRFHFLHGSCNLPVARLTALGSMAAGLVGSAATSKVVELPFPEDLPWWARWLGWPGVHGTFRVLVRFLLWVLQLLAFLTHWEQPRPLLPSPFEHVFASCVDEVDRYLSPAFMIHCGDQIYYDVDVPRPQLVKQLMTWLMPRLMKWNEKRKKTGGLKRRQKRKLTKGYRRNYRQAWFHDNDAARFLESFPQYMVLDDHEIIDNFGTEPEPDPEEERLHEPALRAYDEYVSCRQPRPPVPPAKPDQTEQPESSGGFYYRFEHGNTGFFVLNTRTEREAKDGEMVSEKQLLALEDWLHDENLGLKLRFVVSSVPFVAELRPPGLDRNGERRGDGRADKWCGERWQLQRERIIRALYEKGVGPVVFLVGDLHCTYHARMLIGERARRVTVHELAGGPLNQFQFAERDDFYARYAGTFPYPFEKSEDDGSNNEASPETDQKVLPWTSTIEAFHGAAPSVLKISVRPESSCGPLEVRWTALRTHPALTERAPRQGFPKPTDPHDLCGRIRFHRSHTEVK